MRRRRALALVSAAAVAVAVPTFTATQSQADPNDANQSVTVPSTVGKTATVNFDGTILPGSNPTSSCDAAGADTHDITVNVPAGTYTNVTAMFTFSITWTPSSGMEETSDEILTVDGPTTSGGEGGGVGSSDTASTTETVTASNLIPGDYKVRACGFVNLNAQDYTGTLTIKTAGAAGEPTVPSAPANGLAFSASVAADPQRDEAEPLIETAPDGRTYTCGPTGFGS
ncbi:MAG: hypothetical protein ACR2J0_06010, partial [Mycobacteriales bacterium]